MNKLATHRNYWYVISLVALIPGLVALIIWGLNLGIDFTGGTIWELQFEESIESEQIHSILSANGYGEATVQISSEGDVSDNVAIIRMEELAAAFRHTREVVSASASRDLRRGFTLTFLLLIGLVWIASLAPLVFVAHRVSRPIQQLTAGLNDFGAGRWDRRLQPGRDDEVGRAIQAFNHMADELGRSRDRLVYLTQMSSWQALARKTAHEL